MANDREEDKSTALLIRAKLIIFACLFVTSVALLVLEQWDDSWGDFMVRLLAVLGIGSAAAKFVDKMKKRL